MNHIAGETNISDVFTKCLAKKQFRIFRYKLLHGDRRVLREISSLVCTVLAMSKHDPVGVGSLATECRCHDQAFRVMCTADYRQ